MWWVLYMGKRNMEHKVQPAGATMGTNQAAAQPPNHLTAQQHYNDNHTHHPILPPIPSCITIRWTCKWSNKWSACTHQTVNYAAVALALAIVESDVLLCYCSILVLLLLLWLMAASDAFPSFLDWLTDECPLLAAASPATAGAGWLLHPIEASVNRLHTVVTRNAASQPTYLRRRL